MKIKWIEFENTETGLKIERINFLEDITLLVGLTGVGKTQILNAINYSLKLARNTQARLQPYAVTMGVAIEEGLYEWTYRIERKANEEITIEPQEDYEIVYEKLSKDGQDLLERVGEQYTVLGYDKVPQPKKTESLVSQYSEDRLVKSFIMKIKDMYVTTEANLAIRIGVSSENFDTWRMKICNILKADTDVSFEVFSHLSMFLKIFIAKTYYKDLYKSILETAQMFFPEIEDIAVVEDGKQERYYLQLTVYGQKIYQADISSGMLKTIYHIVELLTMSENALVLIDEFENGLGANSIDALTELVLTERQDLQFIITSHHPKIINGIDASKWRIIDREEKVVINNDYMHYGIRNSKHESYYNLINRWEYDGKI